MQNPYDSDLVEFGDAAIVGSNTIYRIEGDTNYLTGDSVIASTGISSSMWQSYTAVRPMISILSPTTTMGQHSQ